MSVLPVWSSNSVLVAKRHDEPTTKFQEPFFEYGALFGVLAGKVRMHWIYAVSEICKGIAVVTVGDMVIADGFGEFIGASMQSLSLLVDAGPRHYLAATRPMMDRRHRRLRID